KYFFCFQKVCLPKIKHNSNVFHVLKWIGLVVECLAKFVTGSLFAFNVYQDDIKEAFNYTQKEVELQSSLINIGLGFGIFPGLFYDRFGPTMASMLGVLVSMTAYTLLWSTSKNQIFYSQSSLLMAMYFFLAGFGSVFTYMVALNTNIINFDAKHRSKIVGLLNACIAGSPSIFSIVYYRIFQTNNSAESFGSFMLMFAVCFVFTDIICMLFLRLFTTTKSSSTDILPDFDEIEETEMKDIDEIRDSQCCTEEEESGATEHISIGTLLSQIDYWLFLCLFSFSSLVGLVYLNNLTVITKSNGLSSHDQDIVLIIPITNAIVSSGTGVVSDLMKEKLPRVHFLVMGCVLFTGCAILAMIWGDDFAILCVATLLCGAGMGFIWTLGPTVLSEMLYIGDIGRNWGIALLVSSLIGWAVQEAFGSLYDNETPLGKTNCTSGMKCVRTGLMLLVISGCVSIACGVALLLKRNINRWFECCRK
ncbi:hypothetical protein FSP39_023549, partial [Pinctada imbricata]